MERHKLIPIIAVVLALLVAAGLFAIAQAGQAQGRAVAAMAQGTTAPTAAVRPATTGQATAAPIQVAAAPASAGPGSAFLTMSPQAGFPLDPLWPLSAHSYKRTAASAGSNTT